MQATALYRHFNATGQLLYIGISSRPATRTAEHYLRSSWFIEVARIDIEWFGSRLDAEQAEWAAIRHEKPLHNKAFARKPPAPVERFVVLNASGKQTDADQQLHERNVKTIVEAKRRRARERRVKQQKRIAAIVAMTSS